MQGGLTTGLLHALVATDLPGPGSVFLSQNWKFTAPVYIGDTITAEAEVTKVHESKPVTPCPSASLARRGKSFSTAKPGATRSPPAAPLRLLLRELRLNRDLDLVAHDDAAGLERHVPDQPVVAPLDLRRRR